MRQKLYFFYFLTLLPFATLFSIWDLSLIPTQYIFHSLSSSLIHSSSLSLSLTFSLSHTHPSIALSHSNSLIISIPFALSLSLMHLVLIDEPVLNRLHLICLSIHLCFYEYSYPSICLSAYLSNQYLSYLSQFIYLCSYLSIYLSISLIWFPWYCTHTGLNPLS